MINDQRALASRITDRPLTRRGLLAAGAAVSVGAVAGCGGRGGGDDGDGTVDLSALPAYVPFTGVKADLPAEVDRCSDGFFAYPKDPPRVVADPPGDGKPITALVPTSFQLPSPVDRNAFWQEMNSRIGSDLDITLVSAPEYDAKFATTVAGSQLPEMFYVGATTSLPAFMGKTAADLTPHLAGDAIEQYPGLANLPADSWKACIFDGKLRAIPISRGLTNLSVVFARTDILAEEGIEEEPSDFEAFSALCKQLTAKSADRFALGGAPLGFLRSMLDIPGTWKVEDGEFVSVLADERQEQALEAARAMRAAGVIHPEGASTGTPAKKLWLGSGTICFHPDSFIAWFSLYLQNKDNDAFRIKALDVPGFNGGRGTQLVPIPNAGRTAINAESADRVETLLKVASWLASPFGTEEYLLNKYGLPGEHYTLEGTDPVLSDTATDVQIGSLYLADADRVLYSPGRQQVVEQAHAFQRTATEKSVKDPTLGLHSETAERRMRTLQREVEAAEGDIIAGRRPVAAWTAVVKKFHDDGGSQIAREYTKALAAQEGR